jgi:hypothetical protein
VQRMYRASALGGCLKAQIAEKLNFTAIDTSGKMERFANEGALHEEDVVRRLAIVEDRQREVTLELMPSVVVVGHLDGIFRAGDVSHLQMPRVLEVKSMSDDAFKKWKENGWDTAGLVQKYKWQVSVYMLATGLGLYFVVKNRNTGEWSEVLVDEPFYSKQDILSRVLEIEKWVRRGELPEECDVKNFPCPFYYLEQQESLELAEDEALEVVAIMYEECRKQVKAAELRQKEARRALDTALAGREKVTTAKAKVTYYEVKTKKLAVDKMKDDGVEVDKYYVEVIGKRLRVTVHEDNDEGRDETEGRDDAGPSENLPKEDEGRTGTG